MSPPGRVFYTVVVAALMWLWWALGAPGFAYVPLMPLSVVVLGAGIVWTVKVIAFWARARRDGTSPRAWIRFAVAPALVAAFIAAAAKASALEVRWAVSRDAFEQKARQAQLVDREEEAMDDLTGRIGVYRIVAVDRLGDAVFFYEAHGSLFDDAGFAYVPDGPSDDLEDHFERPHFEHLEGDWYVWTASW